MDWTKNKIIMKSIKIIVSLIILLQINSCKQPINVNKETESTKITNDLTLSFDFLQDNKTFTWNKKNKTLTYNNDDGSIISKTISSSAADLLEKNIDLVDFIYLSNNDYAKGIVGNVQFVNVSFVEKDLEIKFKHSFLADPPGLKNLVDYSEFRILAEVPDNPFDTPEQDAITYRVEQEYYFWFLCNYIQSLK
jgi:hypothetical protein